jgi:hypothetical protein
MSIIKGFFEEIICCFFLVVFVVVFYSCEICVIAIVCSRTRSFFIYEIILLENLLIGLFNLIPIVFAVDDLKEE